MRNHRGSPRVSIIIPNYNAAELLPETLTSLGNLNYPEYEVIVVDAGSSDGSAELVRAQFPWARLVALSGRVGVATALNVGVRHSAGEVLVLDYNSDEIAGRDWLARLVSALERAPERSIVGSTRLLYGMRDIVDECGVNFYPFGISTKRFCGRRLWDCPQRLLQTVDYVGLMALDRLTYEKLGPLDERFFIYGEDAEYCLRLKRAGGGVFVTPQALTWHKIGGVVGALPESQHYYLRRSMVGVVLEHFPPFLLPVAALGFLALLAADFAMVFPLVGRLAERSGFPMFNRRRTPAEFLATLRAYGWSVAHLPGLMQARRRWSKVGPSLWSD